MLSVCPQYTCNDKKCFQKYSHINPEFLLAFDHIFSQEPPHQQGQTASLLTQFLQYVLCLPPFFFSLSHLSKSQAHFISTYCVCSQKKSDKKVVDVVWLTQEGVFPTHKESLPLKLPNASSCTLKV